MRVPDNPRKIAPLPNPFGRATGSIGAGLGTQRPDRLEHLDRLSLPTLPVSDCRLRQPFIRPSGQTAKILRSNYSLASPVPISAALAETRVINPRCPGSLRWRYAAPNSPLGRVDMILFRECLSPAAHARFGNKLRLDDLPRLLYQSELEFTGVGPDRENRSPRIFTSLRQSGMSAQHSVPELFRNVNRIQSQFVDLCRMSSREPGGGVPRIW